MITNSPRKHHYRKKRRSHPSKLLALLGFIVLIAVSFAFLIPSMFKKKPPESVMAMKLTTETLAPPSPTNQTELTGSVPSNIEEPISTPEPSGSTEDVLEEENLEAEDHCAEETTDSGDIADTVSSATTSDQKESSLALGDHSSSVSKLQERLTELQYFENEITDYYGPLTESSVRLFQQQNGLEDDGIAGLQTLELLYSEDAKPNQI